MKQKGKRRQSGAPTIADVAKHAGVSPMTVSRVINDEDNVRDSTRKSVLASIDALGYSPNQAARSLAGADQIRIGLLYDRPDTSYVSAFLVSGLRQTSRRNVQLVVKRSDTADDACEAIDRLAASGIDGIILPPPLSDWPAVIRKVEDLDLPTVLAATARPHSTCSAVGIDDYAAAREVVAHLARLGHKRIGFITGDPGQEASERRLAGYRDEMARHDLPIDELLIAGGRFTYRSGLDAATTLLDNADPPTAIFASNDEMAAATVAVAHRRGIDVPGDLSVCGFDDTYLARTVWPELTTIHQPIEETAQVAVDHMIDKIRARRAGGRAGRKQIVLSHTLVRRESDAQLIDD